MGSLSPLFGRVSAKHREGEGPFQMMMKIYDRRPLEAQSLVILYEELLSRDCISFLVLCLTRRDKHKSRGLETMGLFYTPPKLNLPLAVSLGFIVLMTLKLIIPRK